MCVCLRMWCKQRITTNLRWNKSHGDLVWFRCVLSSSKWIIIGNDIVSHVHTRRICALYGSGLIQIFSHPSVKYLRDGHRKKWKRATLSGVWYVKTRIWFQCKSFSSKYWQLSYTTHNRNIRMEWSEEKKNAVRKKKKLCVRVLFVKWKIDARCFTIHTHTHTYNVLSVAKRTKSMNDFTHIYIAEEAAPAPAASKYHK